MQIVQGAVAALLFACSHSHAAYTVRMVQSGPDVVATGSGSLDTSSGQFGGSLPIPPAIVPQVAQIFVGAMPPAIAYLVNGTGPADFGPGNGTAASSATGDPAGAINGGLVVPVGYVSGTPLAPSTTTWAGTTIAALGVTPGTYVWRWGAGASADSFTLEVASPGVSATSIPTVNEWALMAMSGVLAITAFAALGRRKT